MKKIVFLLSIFYTFNSSAQVSITNPPYQENFDNIGTGLPAGFSVQTESSFFAAGKDTVFTNAPTSWATTTTGFYNCASATNLTNTASVSDQNSSSNRALSVRPKSTFLAPGEAIVFKMANTTNKENFQLKFLLQSLDRFSFGITTWRIDYGFGVNPSNFTTLTTTTPSSLTSGGSGSAYKFSYEVTANFGNTLNNKSEVVWIRLFIFSNNTAVGTTTMSGIDDWNLS